MSSVSSTSSTAAGPAQSKPAPSGSAVNGPKFDNVTFLLHIDIFIFAVFVLFALCTLPRVFIRYSRKSELALGHIIRSVPSTGSVESWKRNISEKAADSTSEFYQVKAHGGSTESHSSSASQETLAVDEESLRPHRTRSLSSILHPIKAALGHPVTSGYSVGKLIIMLGYFMTLLYATIYKSSPFSDPTRSGVVAMSQLPIVFALGTKNNIFGVMLSLGYEKLNFLHRFVGRLTAVAGTIHALGFIYKWTMAGTFQKDIAIPRFTHGLIALVGLHLLVWFSTPFWRTKCYNVFLFSHIAGFILFPVGLALHYPVTIPWVSAGGGIYVLDHIIRMIKTRVSKATLRPMPELGLTRIEIPGLNAGWRAGQHVRLRVISSGMGILGWSEVHPFTIASVGGDSMVLMCKKTGSWTNKLYNMASSGDGSEKAVMCKTVNVIVEGPYGGIGHTMLDRTSGALFVSGGSGITFSLAAIEELLQKDGTGQSSVRVIELVWCVQTASSLESMLPTFVSLVQQARSTVIHISVYYTRAIISGDPSKLYSYLPPNIVLAPGRPRISAILEKTIDQVSVSSCSGFVVGVCGPVSLGEHVRKAVGELDSDRINAVNGVELCEEIFGW